MVMQIGRHPYKLQIGHSSCTSYCFIRQVQYMPLERLSECFYVWHFQQKFVPMPSLKMPYSRASCEMAGIVTPSRHDS
jgi:hypothetical protein